MPALALKLLMALATNAGAVIQLAIELTKYATRKQKPTDCKKEKDGDAN